MNELLLKTVKQDFPEIKFVSGKKFMFRFPRTIVIGPNESGDEILLLHELGHATLKHQDYKTDIKRLKMEVDAWEKAREFAKRYAIDIDEDYIQDKLDTYRDYLHQKSRCPKCGLTRFQSQGGQYHCPRCENLT